MLRDETQKIKQDLIHLTQQVKGSARHLRQVFTNLATPRQNARKILQNFAMTNESQEGPQTLKNSLENSTWHEARSIVAKILYNNSDMQTLKGQ